MSKPIRSADTIIAAARKASGNKTVAVAMANDASVLEAVVSACDEGIVDAILVGDRKEMEAIATTEGFSLDNCTIEDISDPVTGCARSVELVQQGQAQFLMKGFVKTAILLKALLSATDMKVRDVMSHVAVLDIPGRDRLFLFTDGGMIPKPTLEQKAGLVQNMVDLAHVMGIRPFSFGFLGAYPDTSIPEHASLVSDLALADVDYAGDVTPDHALTRLDGVVATAIEECNTIIKGLTLTTDTVFSGLVMGAKAPVCLVSRSDSATNKKASLALGVLYANGGVS